MSKESHLLPGNRLLSALPATDYHRLRPSLKPVYFPKDKILYQAGEAIEHAYFLTSGMISLVAATENGSTVAVAIVGREGLVGIPTILGINVTPYQLTAQMSAHALKIKGSKLKEEFERGGPLQGVLLRYTYGLLSQVTQSAVCNRFHSVEERLCRWLLLSHDRAKSDTLHLTQEFLSQIVGTPRTNVTMAAGNIQKMGLISYSRGKISVLNRRGLEAVACECYKMLTDQGGRLAAA